jgi:hypothetical protein
MKYNPATSTSSEGFSRGKTGECVNEYTGKANDGALINKGRGPTGGGTSVPNRGKEMYTSTAQVRTPGGTKEFPKRGKESFNFGRGPTKGNQ